MDSKSLVFRDTHFDTIDRDGQPWLRGHQIGVALGYVRSDIIQKLYRQHSDEFGPDMTAVVKMPTAGGEQEVRIFSPRGCYALGMFARTPVAKAFRAWVLDVLEGRVKMANSDLPDPSWLAEGRKKLLAWSEAARAGEKSVFPVLDDQTVAGLLGYALQSARFLVTVGDDGRLCATSVPSGAFVMTKSDMLKALVEPNGTHLETQELIDFGQAVSQQLARRCQYYERKAVSTRP